MCGILTQNIHSCILRETEYKGLQLSLDQVTSKTSYSYNTSNSSNLAENCKIPKSRICRTKAKARLSPYTQVSASPPPDRSASYRFPAQV